MQGIFKNVRENIAAAGAAAAGGANEIDPDPDKILLAYVAHGTAPLWVDPRLETECHHCRDKFKKGHQHYCRLCGHQFCSMCTGKYHVPDEFKKKGKEGAVRVCFDCRDATLERRARVDPLPKPLRPRLKSRRVNGALHIYPPQWAQQFEYENCVQCRAPYGKHPYHCRVCGDMFCSSCTTKTEVPNTFRKKINKTGPVRVCFECRHKIRGGAHLERDISQIPHDMMADDRKGGGSFAGPKGGGRGVGYGSMASLGSLASLGGSFMKPGGGAPAGVGAKFRNGAAGVDENGSTKVSYTDDNEYDPLATVMPGKAPKPMPNNSPIVHLSVFKKGDDGAPMAAVCTLELPRECTLVDVHEELLHMFPSLGRRQFHYLCRDAPVLEVHWDIFTLDKYNQVVIAKGPPVYGLPSGSSPAAPVGNTTTNSNFSMTDNKTTGSNNSATGRSDSSSSSSSPPAVADHEQPPMNNVEAAVAGHRQSYNASPNIPSRKNPPPGVGAGIGIRMPGATQINSMAKGRLSPVARGGKKSPAHDFGAAASPRQSSPGLAPQNSYHSSQQQNSSPQHRPQQHQPQPQARKAKLVGVPTTMPSDEDVPPPPVSRSGAPTPMPAARQSSSKRARRKMELPHPDAIWVHCKYTYTAQTPTNISFNKHDILVVIKHEPDSQWWFGEHTRVDIDDGARVRGWFPSTYVRQCDAPDDPTDTDSDTDEDEYTRRDQRPPVKLPSPKAVRTSLGTPAPPAPTMEEKRSRFSDTEQSPSHPPYHDEPASPQQMPGGGLSPDMSITQAAFRSADAPSPMSLNHKRPGLQQPKPQKQRPTSPLLHGRGASNSRPVGAIGGPRGAPNFRMPSRESSPAMPQVSPGNGGGMPQRSSSAMRRSPNVAPRLTSPPMDRPSSAMSRLASTSNGSSSYGGGVSQRGFGAAANDLPPPPMEDTVPGPPPPVQDEQEDVPPPPADTNQKSAYSGRRTVDKNKSAYSGRFSQETDLFATQRATTPVQQLQHPDVHQESAAAARHSNSSNGGSGGYPPQRSSPAADSRSGTPNPFLNAPGMEDTVAPHKVPQQDDVPPPVSAPASPFSDDEDDDGEKSPTTFNRPTGGYLNRKGKINPVRKKRQAGRRITLLQSSRGLFDD